MIYTVFHETAVGLLGAALGQPVMAIFIAVGIMAGALFDPSADTARHICFVAEFGVALILFLAWLTLDWRLARRAQVARTRGRAWPGRLRGSRR